MKQKLLATTILTILSTSPVLADDISGGPRADFGRKELIVPCVKIIDSDIKGLSGLFFDVALKQKGESLIYEVTFGEMEDDEVCIAAAEAMLEADSDTSDVDGEKTHQGDSDSDSDGESDDDLDIDSDSESDDDSDSDSGDDPDVIQ